MPWTAPRDWVTGELVTSTIMNQAIRDNLKALSSIPKVLVSQTAGTALAGADTYNTCAWASEGYDTDAIHDNATNNSRLTCKTAGVYWIYATMNKDSADIALTCRLLLNGGTVIDEVGHYDSVYLGTCKLGVAYPLAVNDYVEVQAKSNNGTGNTATSSRFGMTRISD